MLTQLNNLKMYAGRYGDSLILVLPEEDIPLIKNVRDPCSYTSEEAFSLVKNWIESKDSLLKFDENWHSNLRLDIINTLSNRSDISEARISTAFCIFEQN